MKKEGKVVRMCHIAEALEEQGVKKGEYTTLFNLYKNNKISLETALESISMSRDEFFETAKKYQLN